MSTYGRRELKRRFPVLPLTAAAIVLVLAVVFGLFAAPTASWFFLSRNVAAVAEIDNPTSIYITAGNREDVTYLDMSSIDLEVTPREKYFVFSVGGLGLSSYQLQLAYTNNNQFSYELYHAVEVSESDTHKVAYLTHNDPPSWKYYAIDPDSDPDSSESAAIAGHFLNLDGSSGDIRAGNGKHEDTYDSYSSVHPYAEPLYWQTNSPISVRSNGSIIHPDPDDPSKFCDYYIIKVTWPKGRTNDRETDLLYISASA